MRFVSSHQAKDRTIIKQIHGLSPFAPFVLASHSYRFANIAAAPPATSAAVGIAANGPAPAAIVIAADMVAGVYNVAAEIPLVNGAACTGVAPAKAGVCDMAVGFGTAAAAIGLSTLVSKGQRGKTTKVQGREG